MHRQYILQQLLSYEPLIDAEKKSKNRMISFIKMYSNCFDRSLNIGHMTASAWLINQDNTKVLLMHHTKLDRWLQLGGHCDTDPNVLRVAIKEVQEESGINAIEPVSKEIFDIDIHLIPANKNEKAHYHYDVRFLLQVKSNEKVQANRESKELRWIGRNLKDLPTKEPSVVRMFKKWIRQVPYNTEN